MKISDTNIEKAIQVLAGGGIVIFPTDTVYGIGCLLNKPDTIKKLFSIRKRPQSQATPVLVSSIEMAYQYYRTVNDQTRILMGKYWPGALTIISEARTEKIPELVRGGTSTIGLRMPKYPDLLKIISMLDIPILGPSANFHGTNTPKSFSELDPELTGQVDLVLEGDCIYKQASTVVDCTVTPYKIVRQGVIEIA